VVVGKESGAAIDLSAIDLVSGVGVGGFVINGENANDFSGWSVSSCTVNNKATHANTRY
jgi:hypothetical protein